MKKKIRELAGSAPPALTATQYLGISNNETHRAKGAREAWLTNEYPLIAHGYSRQDCQEFLDQEYPGHPVLRSACYFCPFRNKSDWETIRKTEPGMYQDALAMERQMQDHPRGPWFLRAGGLQATETKRGLQGTLFENDPPSVCLVVNRDGPRQPRHRAGKGTGATAKCRRAWTAAMNITVNIAGLA